MNTVRLDEEIAIVDYFFNIHKLTFHCWFFELETRLLEKLVDFEFQFLIFLAWERSRVSRLFESMTLHLRNRHFFLNFCWVFSRWNFWRKVRFSYQLLHLRRFRPIAPRQIVFRLKRRWCLIFPQHLPESRPGFSQKSFLAALISTAALVPTFWIIKVSFQIQIKRVETIDYTTAKKCRDKITSTFFITLLSFSFANEKYHDKKSIFPLKL